jgi:hypothetical protein
MAPDEVSPLREIEYFTHKLVPTWDLEGFDYDSADASSPTPGAAPSSPRAACSTARAHAAAASPAGATAATTRQHPGAAPPLPPLRSLAVEPDAASFSPAESAGHRETPRSPQHQTSHPQEHRMRQLRPFPQVIVTKKAARAQWRPPLGVRGRGAAHGARAPRTARCPNGDVVDVVEENGTYQGTGLSRAEQDPRARGEPQRQRPL